MPSSCSVHQSSQDGGKREGGLRCDDVERRGLDAPGVGSCTPVVVLWTRSSDRAYPANSPTACLPLAPEWHLGDHAHACLHSRRGNHVSAWRHWGSESEEFVEPASARTPWSHHASSDDETGVPTGRSTAGWRLEILDVHASTCEQPRNQRVGVPHVTGCAARLGPTGRSGQTAPNRGCAAHEPGRCDADRTRDSLVRIGMAPPRHRGIS
jgi:hypothetical protein